METVGEKSSGNFLKQGSILAAASIIVRLIGLIYRIPMANIIGDEGNGIYSAAFEIYNILLILSSYGMPMAVSKMVSSFCSRKRYKNAYFVFYCSLIFSVVVGAAFALFMYFGADMLEKYFFAQYRGIALPLRVLAPTIFVVAVMGTFRGLFQGRNTMIPTAVSQIFEQVVNAFVSVAAAYMLMRGHATSPNQAAFGAAGGTMGTLFGALTAFAILLIIFLIYRPTIKKQKSCDTVSEKETLRATYKLILCTVVPIILSQTVYQLSGIVDVTLFNAVMGSKNVDAVFVSSLLGIYSTKYRTLASVPIAISTAMASSMVPGLVEAFTQKDFSLLKKRESLSVKFNMLIAFPCAVGLAVLALPIVKLLFPNTDYQTGAYMLMLGSSCVIFYALSTVTSGVLQSVDRMRAPVIHSAISLGVHICLVYVLLRFTGLNAYALVIGNVTYPLLVCLLNARSVRKALGVRQEIKRTFLIPLLASLVMGVITLAVYEGLLALSGHTVIALFPAILVAIVVYFALALRMGAVTREELAAFPFGTRLTALADKFRLLKD